MEIPADMIEADPAAMGALLLPGMTSRSCRDMKANPETAIPLIGYREEYLLFAGLKLSYYGEGVTHESLTLLSGHRVEKWDVQDPATRSPVVVYFNIDALPAVK